MNGLRRANTYIPAARNNFLSILVSGVFSNDLSHFKASFSCLNSPRSKIYFSALHADDLSRIKNLKSIQYKNAYQKCKLCIKRQSFDKIYPVFSEKREIDLHSERNSKKIQHFYSRKFSSYSKSHKNNTSEIESSSSNNSKKIELNESEGSKLGASEIQKNSPSVIGQRPLVWKIQRPVSLGKKVRLYMDLSKDKLTAFVVLSAMAGYAIAPMASDLKTLAILTVGTGMCSAAANSINQWSEVPYDAQMKRTRNRPIVRGVIQPVSAMTFAACMGVAGTTSLFYFVNPITGILGLSNIILYAFIYTPMKRMSIANTWVGAVVGAIPPLMGWTAVTGAIDPGALVLGGILFAWQFPHFNSLAFTIRKDYSVAGYRMMSVLNPPLNSRVSLRYSVAMLPLCGLMSYLNIADYWFLLDSSILNLYLIFYAYKFNKSSSNSTSRPLFFASLVHLPLLLILLILHKNRNPPELENKE
ncbi:Protoheme IX farnesyltransferase, mitochondrial [Smittium culicis]|uniref:Protoheme IX farnesyltransferase, mitochondrial n=1 Tax=Smittium culicis TaxID=133412 RepID=A0A1R1Y3Y4_9FUNG|nr:Protoheme IX farnesyltransferase, mitochondrial [Smittium culicis]